MEDETEGIWISINVWPTLATCFVLWLVMMDKFWRPLFAHLYQAGRLHAWMQVGGDDMGKEKLDLRKVHHSWWGRFSDVGRDTI